MRRHWAGICGVGILLCAICGGSSAGGADASAHKRANGANERMCQMKAMQGTQAEACHSGQVCATESVALAQGAQAQSVAQTGGVAQMQGQTLAIAGADLHLLPRPREIKESSGAAFRVTQRTRIVVSSAVGGREFEGAQMLENEIEQWTGWKLKISDAREMPGGAGTQFYIGDATKESKLRGALEKQGLSMQKGFDEQGYEISADAHRILVGGARRGGRVQWSANAAATAASGGRK